ncbi:hypothetical protein [Streptomyces hokutonensis]|uniref:hypothetical protein n=1 Tax=Streptomyces hokutonensis TaxID=1306990 RepID=UPI0033F085F5
MRTRRALTEAAVALIREGRTVTIAEAAEAADVSLATAYRYFSSPQELLQGTQLLVRALDFTADRDPRCVRTRPRGGAGRDAMGGERTPGGGARGTGCVRGE